MSKELAELFTGPQAQGLRVLFGTVTSVVPLRVMLDSAEIDIGPLMKVRGDPELDERVLVFHTPSGLVVLGRQTSAFEEMVIAVSAGVGDLANVIQNSYATQHWYPHIFRMSDGAYITVGTYGLLGGTRPFRYALRAAGSSVWGAFVAPAGAPQANNGHTPLQVGDTIYVGLGDDAEIVKLVYSGGGITATVHTYEVVGSGNRRSPMGLAYDATNGLLHFFYKRNKTTFPEDVQAFLLAINPSTMATVYGPTVVHATLFGNRDGAMGGDGGNVMEIFTANGAAAYNVTASGSAYTITAETFPADGGITAGQSRVMLDGSDFIAFRRRGENVDYLRRIAGVWQSAWTTIVTIANRGGAVANNRTYTPIRKQDGNMGLLYSEQRVSPITDMDIFLVKRTAGVWGSPVLVPVTPPRGAAFPSFAPSDIGEIGQMHFLYGALVNHGLGNNSVIDLWEHAVT